MICRKYQYYEEGGRAPLGKTGGRAWESLQVHFHRLASIEGQPLFNYSVDALQKSTPGRYRIRLFLHGR
jgi:hypothetical protein